MSDDEDDAIDCPCPAIDIVAENHKTKDEIKEFNEYIRIIYKGAKKTSEESCIEAGRERIHLYHVEHENYLSVFNYLHYSGNTIKNYFVVPIRSIIRTLRFLRFSHFPSKLNVQSFEIVIWERPVTVLLELLEQHVDYY